MRKHVIIVIEGGGAKMPIETAQVEYIEEKLGVPITEVADLMVTTSAGAVIMSTLATQMVTCKELNKILLGKRGESDRKTTAFLKKMFTSRGLLSVPRYDRQSYVRKYKDMIPGITRFEDSNVPLIVTSVNECDGRTHFFKSWEHMDGWLDMTEVTCRSFAAMWFFGEMIDRTRKALWTDGGVGIFNLPLTKAYVQARANGWLDAGHHTHILSICSGYSPYTVDFKKYAGLRTHIARTVKGLKFFINPGEGGGARAMCTMEQIREMDYNAKSYNGTDGQGWLTHQYTQWTDMPKKLDAMDNWKARWQYYDKGAELAQSIDLDALRK